MVLLSHTLVISILMCIMWQSGSPLWDPVVKDPPDVAPSVPGILGMNVIQQCYRELFGAHGLFKLSAVAQAPGPVIEALQKCHQASNQPLKTWYS